MQNGTKSACLRDCRYPGNNPIEQSRSLEMNIGCSCDSKHTFYRDICMIFPFFIRGIGEISYLLQFNHF